MSVEWCVIILVDICFNAKQAVYFYEHSVTGALLVREASRRVMPRQIPLSKVCHAE